MTGFLAAARRDGTLRRTAVAAAVLAAVFRFLWQEPWAVTLGLVAAGTGASLAVDYADHRGTPTAVRHLVLGGALVAVTGGWWALEGVASAPPPLAAVGLAAGSWFALDGWTARRTGHPDARAPPGGGDDELADLADGGLASEFRAFRGLGEVGRAIDGGATTPAAIAAELDRPVAAVEDDLDALDAAGVVETVDGGDDAGDSDNHGSGSGDGDAECDGSSADDSRSERRYRLTDRAWSPAESVASWPRRLLARLVRPFRLLAAGGG